MNFLFILSAQCALQPLSMKSRLKNLFGTNPSALACTRDPAQAPAPVPAMVLSSLLRVHPCFVAPSLSTAAGPEFSPVPAGFPTWRGAGVGENLFSLAPHALKVFRVDSAIPGKPWGHENHVRIWARRCVKYVSDDISDNNRLVKYCSSGARW